MEIQRLGLIAGNGPLPLLVVDEADRRGIPVTVAAIEEETDPAIEERRSASVSVEWMGVGQLGKLLKLFRRQGVDKALMMGQVKHVRIFARGSRSPWRQLKQLPDLRMLKLLASLPKKDTESLIGGIIGVLGREGIELVDSTLLLSSLLADEGLMTGRAPTVEERRDFDYGRRMAREIARLDIGQTVVIRDQAVVAVEAMEGTDAAIRRAAQLAEGERLTVVKVSRPHQDMRFDVPVVGTRTLETLDDCGVTALSIDAGRTLMIDKPRFLDEASRRGICVEGAVVCSE